LREAGPFSHRHWPYDPCLTQHGRRGRRIVTDGLDQAARHRVQDRDRFIMQGFLLGLPGLEEGEGQAWRHLGHHAAPLGEEGLGCRRHGRPEAAKLLDGDGQRARSRQQIGRLIVDSVIEHV